MTTFGYCAAWPDELKELSRRHYRALCRVQNLEAAITRTDPNDFDNLMDQLELARQEIYTITDQFRRAKWEWEWEWEIPQTAQRYTAGGRNDGAARDT